MIQKKIRDVQRLIRATACDELVLMNAGTQTADDLLYYLLLIRLEYGLLIVPARGRAVLYAIPFEVNQLQRAYPTVRVRPLNYPAAHLLAVHLRAGMRVAIRQNALCVRTMHEWKKIHGVRWTPLQDDARVMAVKHPEEIKRLRQAAHITDEIFSSLCRAWRKFKTEQDAARFVHTACIARGVDISFPPIVASGAHASDPHHQPKDTALRRGFCVIDMGVRHDGYCSDMTRTVFLGTPTRQEKAQYQHLRAVQEKTTQFVRPGATMRGLDDAARAALGKTFAPLFIHGIGPGLGTQVHEGPSVADASPVLLAPGMVITIEPGIYESGAYGIRIEDDVVVTKHGHEILTQSTRELIVLRH